MIPCRRCGISYSPGYATCPQCHAVTPREPRLAYLAADAARRVDAGQPAAEVRADLIGGGFSEIDADVIVRGAVGKLRRETRRDGMLRLLIGFGMTALGACSLLAAFLTAGRWAAYLLIGGTALIGSGLLAILSGAISALTGRTPPIGPIPRETEVVED
jgi:hypothetical protein